MTNPILMEVTRGPLVESFHTGALAVVDGGGDVILAVGDVSRDVFPRSAVKAIQCLPLVETGAADAFRYGDAEIALACGSHIGTDQHVGVAAQMLSLAGLDEEALGCGAHTPLGAAAKKALWRVGGAATQLHNNCSGKHAGMVATAKHVGDDILEYWSPDHPIQRRVLEVFEDLSERTFGSDVLGIDGCSIPNWAMPLSTMAHMFAKLMSGTGLTDRRRDAVQRILAACWAKPELIAGRGRADSAVMQAEPGRVFMKTGAEGVYCGGFPELGWGFALKIDDGLTRASAGTAVALVESVLPGVAGVFDRNVIKSWRGAAVGRIQTASALAEALAKLPAR